VRVLIHAVIYLPLVAAVLLLLIPKTATTALKGIALAATIVTFVLSLGFLESGAGGISYVHPWIGGAIGALYHVRVDGWSLFFVLLTTFVSVPAIWAAFSYADASRLRGYLGLLLAFEWTLLGLFTAGDLLLFYVYWDLMLVPVFLLLVGYADTPQARRAAWGYLLYNGAGGLVLLLGVVGLVISSHTFEVLGHSYAIAPPAQAWLFAAFALAFLIKTPVFPFHAWLPATYTYAPPPVVAMVSAVQSKAGLYGLIVFALPLFPQAAHRFAPALLVLAVVSIVYGALTALGQDDAKTLVAFSSLSHLGLVILALFSFAAIAVPASIVMIAGHGVIVAALFLLLGFIEERTGTRDLSTLGGLAAVAPRLAVFMLIAAMAALGLPGLASFSGEFLIFIGAWQTQPVYTAIALVAVVLASVYMLKMFQGIVNGALPTFKDRRHGTAGMELNAREIAIVAPLVAAMFFIGLWPAWINARSPASSLAAAALHEETAP